MADNDKAGKSSRHPAADRKNGGPGTLLPMLIGGLALITVGMAVVAIFV